MFVVLSSIVERPWVGLVALAQPLLKRVCLNIDLLKIYLFTIFMTLWVAPPYALL